MRVCLLALTSVLSLAAQPVRFALQGTDRQVHTDAQLTHSRATVFLFLGVDCPISNRYSPVIEKLREEFAPQGVNFYAVFADRSVDAQQAKAHLADYSLALPGLLDSKQQLARATGAHVTPEAVVVSPDGRVLYRGRIDDRYVDFGKTRAQVQHQDLREALVQVLAGETVTQPVTKALGCAIVESAS